ncbi:GNAT family N-acetyltransferase [Ensifer canadensis]
MQLDGLRLPITTDRLSLRHFTDGDFESYASYHSLPEVYRYLYADAPTGSVLTQKFHSFLAAQFAVDGDYLVLAVCRSHDSTVVGEVILKLASTAAQQGEIGYIFHPAFRGMGYATEAVSALITAAFSTLRFHRLFARLDPKNLGSVGVVERLKLRREAHHHQNEYFKGKWGDEFIYAVLASEWGRHE